jgi:hypothetical protein
MVDQPAVLIRPLVKITNCRPAEVREVVTEFLRSFSLKISAFSTSRRARHLEGILACSLFVRPCASLAQPFGQERHTSEKAQAGSRKSAARASPNSLQWDFRLAKSSLLGLTGAEVLEYPVCFPDSSDNDNHNDDGRAGVSGIEIDALGLVQWE